MTDDATPHVPDEWQGILAPGERILWQGAPRRAFYWRREYHAGLIAALILLVLRPLGSEPMEDLLLLLIPVVALGRPLWDAFKRRHAFFTLTDRRGIVGLDLPVFGRKLEKLPLSPNAPLRLDHRGATSAVYFAEAERTDRKRTVKVPRGFEGLDPDDAAEVHAILAEMRSAEP